MKRKKNASGENPRVTLVLDANDVHCAVCSSVICDPATLGCSCARAFCHACLEKCLLVQQKCPVCKSDVDGITRCCRQWSAALDDLTRPCPNVVQGCNKKGNRREMCAHSEAECPHRLVTCTNSECDQRVPFRNLSDHVRVCSLHRCRNFKCKKDGRIFGCSAMGTKAVIRSHESRCPYTEEILSQIAKLCQMCEEDGQKKTDKGSSIFSEPSEARTLSNASGLSGPFGALAAVAQPRPESS